MPHSSRAHLDAIGIPVWVRRRAPRAARQAEVPQPTAGTETAPVPASGQASVSPATAGTEAAPVPTPKQAKASLATTGTEAAPIPASGHTSVSPATAGTEAAPVPTPKQANVSLATTEARASPVSATGVLETIDAQVRGCRKCELHRTRTRTVFGVGRPGAACMFIGEAPGAEEDARGEPFVGRAGKLLDAMLAAIDLGRDDVYIANIVKCRPPRNRDPHADEITACSGYLKRQIEAVAPRLLVAAGRVAAQSLLSTMKPIGHLRGRTYRYGEDSLPVLVMYHPAYFLRSPREKRKAWDDLVRLRSMLSDDAANVP